MARRLVLHVGLPKTGTTYVQDVLWANKAALLERGVLLPGRHRRRHLLASLDVREDPGLSSRAGDVAHPWQDLVDEVLASDVETALITHEFFGAASEEQVRRAVGAFPDHEVHVVVTAREIVGLGLSYWQEWVKNGGPAGVDRFPPRDDYDPTDEWGWAAFDLADVLRRWGAVVPHERVHVMPVRLDGEPSELWRRFAALVGIDPEGLLVPEEPSNASLGLVDLELLRRVNAKLEDFHSAGSRGRWIRGYLATERVLPLSRERFTASEELLDALEERGRAAVAAVRNEGYDVVGDLALLEPRRPVGVRHPSEVSDAEMLDAATTAIARLMTEVRSVTRERNALQESLSGEMEQSEQRVTLAARLRRLRREH